MPGVDGPGGVLVFAENWVLYRNEGHPELRVPIPRREFLPEDKGVLIVAWALFHQRVIAVVRCVRRRTSSSTWRRVSWATCSRSR